MTEGIEIHNKMWIKASDDNLEFLGLKKNQALRIKDLREIIKERKLSINIDEEIKRMIISNQIIEISQEEAFELGGIDYRETKFCELNSKFIGLHVELDCQITGEQSQKALTEEIFYECHYCAEQYRINFLDQIEKVIFEEITEPKMCKCGKRGKLKIISIKYMDYSIVYVRDLLDRDEKFEVQKYEPKKIYVVGKELAKSKTITVKGKVIVEPKTNNISIIATDLKPLKDHIEDFQVNENLIEQFKKHFNEIDLADEINPDIVGSIRKIAKKAVIAHLHSVSKIYDITRKKLIRGGINTIFIGDTKTGKSDTAKDVTNKGFYGLSEYVVAETGGRTGFLYSIDTEKGALIWGSLPLNDMGSLVIDGLQAIHSEEMGEFREALELQEIIVNRSIKGGALARTRILGCMNPNKPMNNYIYKCQSISDNYVFGKTPEVTRWDLFIPFCQNDVSSDEVQQRNSKERQIPKDVFINHILWVWSRKPDQIIYTESAVKEIKDKSKDLIDNFALETLPIVHNGVRDILTRISVSKACELHSTDESHEKIIVEKFHVELAFRFYVDVLELLELSRYKEDIEGKSKITDSELIEIAKDLGETEFIILNEVKHQTKSSTHLSTILGLVPKTVKEHYEKLKKHGLVDTRTGAGISLTVKGVKFVR